ncbi:MAG TPA: hypothetical protein ENK88_05385, partial [Campylobacterales bacterium]|nr:hypothetical protein [Campylobacterales bacterium]
LNIVAKCQELGIYNDAQIAYVLATVEHETNNTFKPVREAYWLLSRFSYRKGSYKGKQAYNRFMRTHLPMKKYYPYYGRGFVQLTWKRNYQKFTKILNNEYGKDVDLVRNPDDALDFDNSLIILIHGMIYGTFSGKKLNDYINDDIIDFVNARKIINGTDKAVHISRLSSKYLNKLKEF